MFEYYNTAPQGLLAAASGQLGWRWRFRAGNGKIISSGESYARKEDCLHAIELLKATNLLTPTIQTDD